MSAKLPHCFTDEHSDLHKQIGCMNGIFQLFDRHHFLAGRRITRHNPKRLTPGQSASHGLELKSATRKATLQETNKEEIVKEKPRVSVEPSRASFSSSSYSSTFLLVDFNKTAQPEPSSFHQSIFPETPSQVLPLKQPDSSLHLSRVSLDLRDIVKNTIYREKEEMCIAIKHIDSPRPLQQSQSAQPRVTGFDGSTRVLAKLPEEPWNSKEEKNCSLIFTAKDAPRFSYDGRESRGSLKSTVKLKELPRLSLDSRGGSLRGSASESRTNYLLRDLQRGNWSPSQVVDTNRDPGSNKRPSSVIAKLMGLEAFPDSISTNEGQIMKSKPYLNEELDTISRSSRIADESMQNKVSKSPRISHKDFASSRIRNKNSVMKPTASSRFPLEPAPWRQPDGSQCSKKPAFKNREASTKAPLVTPSVYGEIEKRLTELEFRKSGKDLRARKQILETMQKTKERLEHKKDEQASNCESQRNKYSPNYSSFDQGPELAKRQIQHRNHPVYPTIEETSPSKRFESPIVIIKPAKLIEKTRNSGSSMNPNDGISSLRKLRIGDSEECRKDFVDKRTAEDLTPRNNGFRDPSSRTLPSTDKKTNTKILRSIQASKVPQHMTGESPPRSGRSFGTVSPRLQEKGPQKQSHPTTPPYVSRTRRQSSKQPIESSSSGRKLKQKSINVQQGDDQSSEMSSETRNLSPQGDTISMQSESNISLATQIDAEVTSTNHSDENSAARLSDDRSMNEHATTTQEQPSPVSVLDATFYREDSPSPVKKTLHTFEDDETLNNDDVEWHSEDLDQLLNSLRPNFSSEFNHKKLENIKHLDEASIDHITFLCESAKPDHRYITEILLASGLFKKKSDSLLAAAIQLHPSGHLIHSRLFHVLEQTKKSTVLGNEEHNENIRRSNFNKKIQRKLVFDIVNEILVQKLAFEGFSKLGGRRLSGQKLLKELCSEMDCLQANPDCSLQDDNDAWTSILSADMMRQSKDWTDYHGEIPGLVLNIERLIFKDLINEAVCGEAVGLQQWPKKYCRKLFS